MSAIMTGCIRTDACQGNVLFERDIMAPEAQTNEETLVGKNPPVNTGGLPKGLVTILLTESVKL